jgi:hypothetical protein
LRDAVILSLSWMNQLGNCLVGGALEMVHPLGWCFRTPCFADYDKELFTDLRGSLDFIILGCFYTLHREEPKIDNPLAELSFAAPAVG